MRSFIVLLLACLTVALLPLACVDPAEPVIDATVDVVIVDGTITNVAEPQVIRLNRSRADPFTGRFSDTPLTGARAEVVVNGTGVVALSETNVGIYELPNGFRGSVGNRYQLRFQLADGTRYASSTETMPAVPMIQSVTDQYNPDGLTGRQDGLTASNDIYLTTDDPADQTNYYRWNWTLWERQDWCHTCPQGLIYYERDANNQLVEGCLAPGNFELGFPLPPFIDYECRTMCWEIQFSSSLNLFSDSYTNGRTIRNRRVAVIPFHQYRPCLVEVRQMSLTQQAYQFYQRLDDQTQRTGGLADTPPSAPVGNVTSLANDREAVIGYFSASAVSSVRYWLDRKKVTGKVPNIAGDLPNLFYALNGRPPIPEPARGYQYRPPLAVCVPSDTRTPVKPEGWRD